MTCHFVPPLPGCSDPGPVPDDPQELIELHTAKAVLDRLTLALAEDTHALRALSTAGARLALVDLVTVARHLDLALAAMEARQ